MAKRCKKKAKTSGDMIGYENDMFEALIEAETEKEMNSRYI